MFSRELQEEFSCGWGQCVGGAGTELDKVGWGWVRRRPGGTCSPKASLNIVPGGPALPHPTPSPGGQMCQLKPARAGDGEICRDLKSALEQSLVSTDGFSM